MAEGRALVAAVPNVIEDDPQLALLLSVAAADLLGDVPAAASALHQSIGGERTIYEATWPDDLDPPSVNGDISGDGRLLAVAGAAGNRVEVHDIDAGGVVWSHEFALESPEDAEISAKFVNDDRELLVGVGWYDAESPQVPPEVGLHVFDAITVT